MCVCLCLCAQGLDPHLAVRLPEWQIQCTHLHLHPSQHLAPSDHTTGLRHALYQLHSALAPAAVIVLSDSWHWTAELAAVVQLHPRPQQLQLPSVINGALTDALLGVLVQCAPTRLLAVKGLALQSEQHARAAWRWEEVRVDAFDLADLCRLPDPASAGRAVVVRCGSVDIRSSSVDKVCYRIQPPPPPTHTHTHASTLGNACARVRSKLQ